MVSKLNKEEISRLFASFQNQTLSKQDWTHASHLIVATCFLTQYQYADAICKIKSGIMLLNKEHGTTNSGTGGYHETITIFYCKVIFTFLETQREKNLEELVNIFLNSRLAGKNLPFDFYDKKTLMLPEYRAIYHKETIQPVDHKTIADYLP
jgi:hypothetical protein